MNIEDVKQIPIADYLHSLGYSPVKQQGNGLWYKSPLREEHEASFKVNTDRNLWYDFGAGKGGNIIALAKELYFSDSLPYLLKRIEEQTPNVRPVSFSFPQCRTEPSFQHLEVRDLTHPALLRYLQGRGINIELAKRECKELHFTNNGKPFFAIGFPNMAGGYEVRNSFFKGCIAPKDITHIRQQGEPREKCLVFEGFMDYLSFLTLRMKNCPTMPDLDRQDYVILNSTVNVLKAIDVLYPYERIHCMLDNDETGYKATRAIELEYSYRVRDFSHNYRGYSDLNDYLCGRKQEQKNAASQVQETKQKTGQRAAQNKREAGAFNPAGLPAAGGFIGRARLCFGRPKPPCFAHRKGNRSRWSQFLRHHQKVKRHEKDTGQAGRSSGKETDGKAEKGSQYEADRVAVLRHQEASRGSRVAHQ